MLGKKDGPQSFLERQTYHLRKKLRICNTVCTSEMGFHPAQESSPQLHQRCRGSSWNHSPEMCECASSAHDPATSGSHCRPCSYGDLSVLSPWTRLLLLLFSLFSPTLIQKLSLPFYECFCYANTSSVLSIEFFKQGEGIGVFYWWLFLDY